MLNAYSTGRWSVTPSVEVITPRITVLSTFVNVRSCFFCHVMSKPVIKSTISENENFPSMKFSRV